MKKQLRDRLRVQSSAELIQSKIYQNDDSIINQLNDFIEETNDIQIKQSYHHYTYTNNNNNGYKNRLKTLASPQSNKHFKSKNQLNRIQSPIISSFNQNVSLIHHRSRNKFAYQRNSQHISQIPHIRTQLRSHIIDFQQKQKEKQKQKRKHIFQNSLFQNKKQQNSKLKIKFDYNRSSIIKNKQFIYNYLLQKCQYCHSIKSQVFRNNLICSNKNCRLIHLYEDFQTFPLTSILYQLQTPSSTQIELQQFVNKINQQIKKIEEWRNSLMELQFQMQAIIESRKQFNRHNKNQLKNFISAISVIKPKKIQNQLQLKDCRQKLQSLQLKQLYEQFNRWKKIDIDKYHQNKFISQLIHKYKPLCFKTINSDIAQFISDITDNFKSITTVVSSSEYLTYNFYGDINKMDLFINGSIQLKRQNFLLIQNLQQLRIIFQARKTNRQLKQLFNILPNVNSISLVFDYKLHSHVSSQSFPLIAKTCQLAQKSVQISLINARPQVFQDLLQMSKSIKNKMFIKLQIKMNPYIPQIQWPQYTRSADWGTKILKNIVKNIGNKIMKINLNVPLHINMQQLCEYILNSDYFQLVQLKIEQLQTQIGNEKREQYLNKLLKTIVNKKRLLLGQLINQKRYSSNALNKSYSLTESVYKVLF